LLAAGLGGLLIVRLGGLPSSLRGAWLGFFASVALQSLAAVVHDVAPGDWTFVPSHLFDASALAFLMLAFLAERVDAAYGGRRALAGALAVLAVAALWWASSQWLSGQGDLRAMVLLQALPLLLVPSGAVNLPGRFTSSTNWLWALSLYGLARMAEFAGAGPFGAGGWLSGHTLQHLLSAAAVCCLAYRAGIGSGSTLTRLLAGGEPTQRSTSLNTSS